MNEDEHTDADCVRYVTKNSRTCDGCAAEYGSNLCVLLPPCGPSSRKDGVAVIWVKAEAGSKA